MKENDTYWQSHNIDKVQREQLINQKGIVYWFTGLSASGKSTIANSIESQFHELGFRTILLDGDNIRQGLCKDLGFSPQDRKENIRRIAEVAKLFLETGTITLIAFISPYIEDREMAREIVGKQFIEIFVNTPLSVCEQRDPKGLYKKARLGQIPNFTGIHAPYEVPESPEIILKTENSSIDENTKIIINHYFNSISK